MGGESRDSEIFPLQMKGRNCQVRGVMQEGPARHSPGLGRRAQGQVRVTEGAQAQWQGRDVGGRTGG